MAWSIKGQSRGGGGLPPPAKTTRGNLEGAEAKAKVGEEDEAEESSCEARAFVCLPRAGTFRYSARLLEALGGG